MILLDVNFELGEYKFVWDENKNKKNFKKHGIYFEDAVRVFLDENLIDDYDEFHSDFEDRYRIIGKIRDILVVIYTEREDKKELFPPDKPIKMRRIRIMNNFTFKEIPPLTPEQIKRLDALKDREIDYSDIPPTSPEQLARMRENRRKRLQRAQALKQAV